MKRFSIILSFVIASLTTAMAANDAAPRPNILFIFTDDLGYGDIGAFYQNSWGAMGDRSIPQFGTPSIDTRARDGLMLTQNY